MKKIAAKTNYARLLKQISSIYEDARAAMVKSYWEIGRLIVEEEQGGDLKAAYGDNLLFSLSADLTAKFGSGFSQPNINRMRQFYLRNPIYSPANKLTWSHHIELLSLKNEYRYDQLVDRVEAGNLSAKELRKIIQRENQIALVSSKILKTEFGELWTYKTKSERICSPAEIVLDCGFHIERPVKKSQCKDIKLSANEYTYVATVDKVVDGDTLYVRVDCGFDVFTCEYMRLRDVYAPELGSSEGEQVKRFVVRRLKRDQTVIIRTYSTDMYHRYIADIKYLSGSSDPEEILSSGNFLNQEVLDYLAQRG